jgi:putative NIF3 family GTP cyclohydrolase 1 type 2
MKKTVYRRREFIGDALKAGAAGLILPAVHPGFPFDPVTVSMVIDTILEQVPGGRSAETVDTLKSGTGKEVVTGIVTTMFCTVPVIREAIRQKANFIIAHEPTFYNHADDLNWVSHNNTEEQKKELLESHGIAVWRFHDHWHRMKPDGILYGVLWKTGWTGYSPQTDNVFEIPSRPLGEIIRHLKDSLGIPHLRYIGDPSMSCRKIALYPGAMDGQRQVAAAVQHQPDLMIVGECREWETPEYIRDSRALGKQISLIVLGHPFSEEPGMEWLVQWLQPRFTGLRITHIASGESFSWG